nr:hypothetical protein CFP56_74371 [Quercus suber]
MYSAEGQARPAVVTTRGSRGMPWRAAPSGLHFFGHFTPSTDIAAQPFRHRVCPFLAKPESQYLQPGRLVSRTDPPREPASAIPFASEHCSQRWISSLATAWSSRQLAGRRKWRERHHSSVVESSHACA